MSSEIPSHCDAIVIGGGPAGSTAAISLAKAGHRVVVLERERFPRFHVGESLLPYNRQLFSEMGLLQEMDRKFVVKQGAQFWLGNGKKHVQVLFREGTYNEETSAYQVERSAFDELLLSHAEEEGAVVCQETTVTSHEVSAESVRVRWQQDGGAEGALTGKFLIDATGQANFTGNRERLREFCEGHRKIAIFGHFHGVAWPTEGERAGDIVIVRLEDGWFWLIPLSTEKLSVGLVADSARFKASGVSPAEFFNRTVAGHHYIREKMAAAELQDRLHVISDFTYRNRHFVSPRLIRVGDAAGFLDPIFSSGVYLAMTSAKDAAAAVSEALNANMAMTRRLRKYEKRLHREMDLYWRLIKNFYTTPFLDLFLSPDPPLNLRSAVNSILAGRLNQTFPVRWRLWLFYLLVKIQRRFALAPRTDFS